MAASKRMLGLVFVGSAVVTAVVGVCAWWGVIPMAAEIRPAVAIVLLVMALVDAALGVKFAQVTDDESRCRDVSTSHGGGD